jgi:hypothetical protein
MYIKYLLILSILSLSTYAIEIDNFASGPVCTDSKTFGWVCHNQQDIYITGQGRCIWNGEEKPCTWHGFEFDYKNNEIGSPIECTYTNSEEVSFGNPDEITDENTKVGSYTFSIEEKEGHFFNPQYSILATMSKGKAITSNETTCFSNGKKIFSYNYRFHFPIAKE